MLSKRKLEWLISNKMDFRTRKISKDREGYSIVIKKKISSPRNSNSKYVHIQQQSFKKIHEANIEKGEKVKSTIIIGGLKVLIQ